MCVQYADRGRLLYKCVTVCFSFLIFFSLSNTSRDHPVFTFVFQGSAVFARCYMWNTFELVSKKKPSRFTRIT